MKPYVDRNAYYAHPEPLLLAMLDDDDRLIRKKAVTIIENIRKQQPSPRPIRPYKVPKLIYDADSYDKMIDWDLTPLTEPPLTFHITDDNLHHIIDEPLSVPPYRAHTQSVERLIKLVSDASAQVYGLEATRGLIRAKVASRKLYKKCDTLKELSKIVK